MANKRAVYEGDGQWTLVYKKAREISIEDKSWLKDFQSNQIEAPPNSSLDVDLKETVIINEHGEAIDEPSYKVIKVHGVIKPKEQLSFSLEKNSV